MLILVGGDKGGTGKSHLATSLAVAYQLKGYTTSLIAADRNHTVMFWSERRNAAGCQPIYTQSFTGQKTESVHKLISLHEITIVDCAGYDSEEFRAFAMIANLVILPVDPLSYCETDTLRKICETVHEAREFNPALVARIMASRVQTGIFAHEQALRRAIEEAPDFWPPAMRHKTSFLRAYVHAFNEGRGVHELTGSRQGTSKARAQIDLIIDEIAKIMEIPSAEATQ